MIIFERENSYIMVTQNDHAKVSKEIAENCKDDYFFSEKRKKEVLLAIQEHDRGWIVPDANPIWNDKTGEPYSFIDYPTDLKVSFYKKGLDEVEEMSKYAALLCSFHYTSFVQDADESAVQDFWEEEKKRQNLLTSELGIGHEDNTKETMMYHLDLLKFSDFISLYICLHEPGDNKYKHSFFQNGFPQLFLFATDKPIVAHWQGEENVSLSFSPLKRETEVEMPYKEVMKDRIKQDGILQAYTDTSVTKRKVTFK